MSSDWLHIFLFKMILWIHKSLIIWLRIFETTRVKKLITEQIKKVKSIWHFFNFKGTVSVILITPLCKNGNARFTTVTLKSFVWSSLIQISMFIILKADFFSIVVINKSDFRNFYCRKTCRNNQILKMLNLFYYSLFIR